MTEASQTDVHRIFCGCLKAQKEGARRSVLCDLDQCTRISGIRLPVDKETNEPRGIAFITFRSEAFARAAVRKDEEVYKGMNLNVNIAKESTSGGAGGGGSGGSGGSGGRGGGGGGGGSRR